MYTRSLLTWYCTFTMYTQCKWYKTRFITNSFTGNSPDGKSRLQLWNCISAAVGCISYIQAIIRPDITMATQQCARFCNNSSQEHKEVVKRICRYLLKTRDKGLVLRLDNSKGLECFVDGGNIDPLMILCLVILKQATT